MKKLSIALTLSLSTLFAIQAKAGPPARLSEKAAYLVGMKGHYCIYGIQAYGGIKYAEVRNYDGCYREVWADVFGHMVNFRLPYGDRVVHSGNILNPSMTRPPASKAPRGSGVAAVANIGRSPEAVAADKRHNARIKQQEKINNDAMEAVRAAEAAVNSY